LCLNRLFVQRRTGIPLFETHPKNYFDQKRNDFLASIYSGNLQDTEKIYREISAKIEGANEFSEVDQKAINQIQHAFRTFRKQITANCSNDIKDLFNRTRKAMARAVREQAKNVTFVGYDEWYTKVGLSKAQFRILLKTVATLQITVGCSIFCRRCNEWALPGPRKHFSFDAVTTLIKELFEAGNNEFALYGASDPMDWTCGEKNIASILEFMSAHGYTSQYGLLTKIPKGSEKTIAALLKTGADIGFSITGKNRSNVEKIGDSANQKLDVQHDSDELLIPAGLDEDFTGTKASITDSYGCEITPEGAFFVVPTFTSALNLTGQRRIPISSDATFFLKKRIGRDALPVEYFKPLEVIDLMGREFTLEKLFNAQIENIMLDNGSAELTPPGMMNMREYFRTYELDAVKRRKSLLPAVSKGLIKDILHQGKYKEDSREKRYAHFKQRVRDYFETCNMNNVEKFKKNAFSFYLKSIAEYLKGHPVEREIIRYLRKEDKEKYKSDSQRFFEEDRQFLDSLLEEAGPDTFELFQILLFRLLDDPGSKIIQLFVENNPIESADALL